MLRILATIHHPFGQTATCRQPGLDPPEPRCVRLGRAEASGWTVHLPRLHAAVVCDTPRSLVAYYAGDNVHVPYRVIMHFIHHLYAIRLLLKWTAIAKATCPSPAAQTPHDPIAVGAVT
jgi:hypothetical protein